METEILPSSLGVCDLPERLHRFVLPPALHGDFHRLPLLEHGSY